nr:retrovirus-related Pol polyprotein from transposon TNT 1-94 [Tanacetum cinerariifolium]
MPSNVKTYDGSDDPKDHLKLFQAAAKRERESTEDFVQRLKAKGRHVKGASKCIKTSGFMHGITNPELIKRLHDNIPKSVDEMMRVTTSFLKGEVAASNQPQKKAKDYIKLLPKSGDFISTIRRGRQNKRDEDQLSAKHQLAVKGLSKCKASERNIRHIQVKDIVKEVEDYLNTYSSAEMDISYVDDDLLIPQLLDSRGGYRITNVLAFDKDDFTRPSDTRDTKIAALRFKFNAFKALEGSYKDRYEEEVLQKSRRVGSARKPMDKSKETCFSCGRLGHFQKDCPSNKTSTPPYPLSNTSFNKPKPFTPSFIPNIPQNPSNHQKYYKGKYKGLKAEMDVLSQRIDELTKGKMIKEKVTKEKSMGRNYHEKVHRLLSMTDNEERKDVLDYIHVDLHYVEDQRKHLVNNFNALKHDLAHPKSELCNLKNIVSINYSLQNEVIRVNLENEFLKDKISNLKKVIEKWTCSKVTLDQLLSKQIPGNIVKALGGKGKRKEKNSPKEVLFTKADVSTYEYALIITSDSKDDCDNQEPLPPLLKLTGEKPSACEKGKHHKATFKTKRLFSINKCLHLLNMDLFRPIKPQYISHNKHTLVIVDEYLWYIWVFYLKKKSDVADCIISFIRQMENLNDTKVKQLRSNNGTKFKNHTLEALCDEKVVKAFKVFNIKRQEMKETFHVTFSEDDEAISQSNAEGDAINFNENKSFPDDEFLELRSKVSVTFEDPPVFTEADDHPSLNEPNQIESADHFKPAKPQNNVIIKPISDVQPSPSILPSADVILQTLVPQDRWSREKHIELVNIICEPLTGITTRSKIRDSYAASAFECLYVNFLSEMEPQKLIDALEEGWIITMQEELNRFEKNKVWTLVLKPHGKIIIGTKWIWKNKMDKNGIVIKNKARLVA